MSVRQAARWRRRCTTTATLAVVLAFSSAGVAVGIGYALTTARRGRPGPRA
ncbi:hypothetical protein [Actinoallomurus vinaceus]|uniref:hypothetical protein n=1 Tax=Actinoallomurus vinaceus TaxID=1080074 RepID=UPI0031E667B8